VGIETFEILPLTERIGAEIRGVDLTRPLSNQQAQQIHEALMAHCVIFFRDQPITHEQLETLGRHFGSWRCIPASAASKVIRRS